MVLQFVGAPIAIGGSRLSFRKSSSIMTGIFCLLWNHYCLFDKFSAPHPLSRWKRLRFLWNDRKRVEILPEWQTERIFTSFVTLEASHTILFQPILLQRFTASFVTLEASHTKHLRTNFTTPFHRIVCHAGSVSHNTFPPSFTTTFHRIVCHAGSVSHKTFTY